MPDETDEDEIPIDANRYQELSRETVRYSANIHEADPEILFLGNAIGGEGGEINEKIKKYAREGDEDYLDEIDREIGDIIWYLSRLMDKIDVSFNYVLARNLEKTHYRYNYDKITGEGDFR